MKYITLLILMPGVSLLKLFQELESDDWETVHVKRDEPFPSMRNKRSEMDTYPRQVKYTLSINGKEKKLHLTKVSHLDRNVPMYLLNNDKTLKLHKPAQIQTYATYQDQDVGASILLHCEDKQTSCNLYGGFHHEGEHFSIQPHRLGTTQHRISKTVRRQRRIDRELEHTGTDWSENHITRDIMKQREVYNKRHHVVELLVFLDDSVYKFFMELSGGNEEDALRKMKMYYTLVANDIDLRYQSLSDRHKDFYVNIMINGFVFSTTESGFPWISKHLHGSVKNVYDAETAMHKFAEYQYESRRELPDFDHAMQFSRRDLAFYENGWQTDLLGVAFKGTTCSHPNMAVSVIEDSSYGTTGQTASHELGHSLGSSHDGALGCSDDSQFIMAAFVGPSSKKVAKHMWKMSSCSSDAVYKYLTRMPGHVCTLRNSFSVEEYNRDHALGNGGEVYELDEQCKLRQGKLSFSCMDPTDTICSKGIYCKIPYHNYCELVLAMEGSSCGRGHVCHEGKCVRERKKKNLPLTFSDSSVKRQVKVKGSRFI